MGLKTAQPKLCYSFSLDQAVPSNHLVRRLAAAIDLGFVRGLVRLYYSHTSKPSVDPVVLFKLPCSATSSKSRANGGYARRQSSTWPGAGFWATSWTSPFPITACSARRGGASAR